MGSGIGRIGGGPPRPINPPAGGSGNGTRFVSIIRLIIDNNTGARQIHQRIGVVMALAHTPEIMRLDPTATDDLRKAMSSLQFANPYDDIPGRAVIAIRKMQRPSDFPMPEISAKEITRLEPRVAHVLSNPLGMEKVSKGTVPVSEENYLLLILSRERLGKLFRDDATSATVDKALQLIYLSSEIVRIEMILEAQKIAQSRTSTPPVAPPAPPAPLSPRAQKLHSQMEWHIEDIINLVDSLREELRSVEDLKKQVTGINQEIKEANEEIRKEREAIKDININIDLANEKFTWANELRQRRMGDLEGVPDQIQANFAAVDTLIAEYGEKSFEFVEALAEQFKAAQKARLESLSTQLNGLIDHAETHLKRTGLTWDEAMRQMGKEAANHNALHAGSPELRVELDPIRIIPGSFDKTLETFGHTAIDFLRVNDEAAGRATRAAKFAGANLKQLMLAHFDRKFGEINAEIRSAVARRTELQNELNFHQDALNKSLGRKDHAERSQGEIDTKIRSTQSRIAEILSRYMPEREKIRVAAKEGLRDGLLNLADLSDINRRLAPIDEEIRRMESGSTRGGEATESSDLPSLFGEGDFTETEDTPVDPLINPKKIGGPDKAGWQRVIAEISQTPGELLAGALDPNKRVAPPSFPGPLLPKGFSPIPGTSLQRAIETVIVVRRGAPSDEPITDRLAIPTPVDVPIKPPTEVIQPPPSTPIPPPIAMDAIIRLAIAKSDTPDDLTYARACYKQVGQRSPGVLGALLRDPQVPQKHHPIIQEILDELSEKS